ncbi:MAG: hypothetical protein AAF206_20985 [Bacteroidota bacterium]
MASVIRGFKSSVTAFARNHEIPFAWQRGYYDHIIRGMNDYQRIRDYIRNNPAKWQEDEHYQR